MGAICGRPDTFSDLPPKSQGQRLGSAGDSNGQGQRLGGPSSPAAVGGGGAQRTTGGGAATAASRQTDEERREALARAAEARSAAAATRGSKGGKISEGLAKQKKDGGFREEAIANADRRNDNLVWD